MRSGRRKLGPWWHALEGDIGNLAPSSLSLPGCHDVSILLLYDMMPHQKQRANQPWLNSKTVSQIKYSLLSVDYVRYFV
jgi:hypothetical protein